MSKGKNINLLAIGVAVAIGIFIGSMLDFNRKPAINYLSKNKQEAKIKRLIDNIQYEYVDEIDTDSLLDKTIEQMLSNLDPHSVYIPQDQVNSIEETMDGKFIGIGVQFRMIRDSVTVINVIKDGPSYNAGIEAGDRILIAGKDTLFGKNLSSDEIMGFLKSKQSKPIALNVFRKKTGELLDFKFNRGDVGLKSVPVFYMLDDGLGYIKIELFSRTTYDEFHRALLSLKDQGMQSLVVDLRYNTGGFMDIANDIIDEFLPGGTLIVSTKSKSGRITESFATKSGDFENGNVYVLINEESASASEILAGAIQDNDRGTIVGRRSFGKGLVQQEMNLGDGSKVRLTTARYYTPTGRSIQKPYDHNGNHDYYLDAENRFLNGELYYKDSIPKVDSLKYTTPKGKTVYGGGGIIPDVFVPVDTTMYFRLFHMAHINEFVFDYVDDRRSSLENIVFNDFKNQYDVEEPLNQYLKKYAIKTTEHDLLKWYLKSLIAREIYGEEAFYRIYNERDNIILKVIALENQSNVVK